MNRRERYINLVDRVDRISYIYNINFYDDMGHPYMFRLNNTYYYYLVNPQGDVIRILNSQGESYGTYTYDAWGKVISQTGSSILTTNPLRYRGYYWDSESGFYYLQSRYYDPQIGRFINADDPSYLAANGDFISYNLFAYCGNNPVARKDDGGNLWGTAIIVSASMGGILSAVADVGVQLATTGNIDITQTVIAAAAGAVSGACALIPGGKVATTIASGAINAGLSAGSYALNQVHQGKSVDSKGVVASAISGAIGGIAGNLFRMNSTSSLRSSAEKLLEKGTRKLASAVVSTVKRGAQYQIRGASMLLDYAMRAGTNSGVGSVVGSVINPVVNEVVSAW